MGGEPAEVRERMILARLCRFGEGYHWDEGLEETWSTFRYAF